MITERGRELAAEIAADIRRRKGIGDEWERIPEEVREEILDRWSLLLYPVIDSASSKKVNDNATRRSP